MCKWNLQTIIFDAILAIIINTSATFLAGAPLVFASWYTFTAVAFATNIVAQLIVPTKTITSVLTRPIPNSTVATLVAVLVENFIFVTIISLTEAYVQTAGIGMIEAWLSTYVQLMLIGYIASLVLVFFGTKIIPE